FRSAGVGRLPLNRELVTIKTDVALEQPARALSLRERDVATLRELYTRYGFNQALRELEGNAAPEPAPGKTALRATEAGYARVAPAAPATAPDPALSAPGEHEMVVSRERLDACIAALPAAPEFAFDTDPDSLDASYVRLV